jgi:endonuclease-3
VPRESLDKKRERAAVIVGILKKTYPNAKCSLNFKTVHQLMVATILSAQCTDERVNLTTPALFERYPNVKAFAEADIAELEALIKSTGFFHNKAKSVKNSAIALMEKFGGRMPKQLDLLVTLPGVGRKTGSVILGAGFGLAEGIVVDTHVTRLANLLKLTSHREAVKIEQDLVKTIEQKDWIVFSHLMIDHGRAVCIARRPRCSECPISSHCPSAAL